MKRVGIIGGGQLASMMGNAAKKLGIDLVLQTPNSFDPAVSIASETIFAPIDDATATANLATRCDVITFENEFVNLKALQCLEQQGVIFYPTISSLTPLLDKYEQRCYYRSLGLPVPRFKALESKADLVSDWGFPVVVKARRHGYDGQGTFIVENKADLESLGENFQPGLLLLEEFIPFERELATMACRNIQGEIVVYPVVETYQEEQVCHKVVAPAAIDSEVKLQVENIARVLLGDSWIGVMGIELFLTREGKVLVNEIAPRTHNSGHYTIDACNISQFEMHLRAVTGLPLVTPTFKFTQVVMINLLGYEYCESDYQEKLHRLRAIPQAYLHWYGKNISRPGRKLGHITVLSEGLKENLPKITNQIESIWYENNK